MSTHEAILFALDIHDLDKAMQRLTISVRSSQDAQPDIKVRASRSGSQSIAIWGLDPCQGPKIAKASLR